MNTSFLITLLGFIATSGLVSIFRKLAYRFHLLAIPNARSSHQLPTPCGGGIGIVITFLLGVFSLYLFNLVKFPLLISFLIGGIILALIGFLDDIHHVPAQIRILFHFMAASLVLYLLKGMPPLDLGFMVLNWKMLGTFIGLMGLVWLINLYNFMDGIDGLAGSEAIFVAISVAFLLFLKSETSLIPLFLLLASAAGGFLIWNWSPARVFMGDTGSGFLGFVFGVLLVASLKQGALTPWQWLIILGCFWVDATLTLLHRAIRGEPWYKAHCSHAFQQAVKKIGCHRHVVLQVQGINFLWLLPIAILSIYFPKWSILLTLIAIVPLIIVCIFLKAGTSGSPKNHKVLIET
jgi:Fuc2NAc and GlcNAc transferase